MCLPLLCWTASQLLLSHPQFRIKLGFAKPGSCLSLKPGQSQVRAPPLNQEGDPGLGTGMAESSRQGLGPAEPHSCTKTSTAPTESLSPRLPLICRKCLRFPVTLCVKTSSFQQRPSDPCGCMDSGPGPHLWPLSCPFALFEFRVVHCVKSILVLLFCTVFL